MNKNHKRLLLQARLDIIKDLDVNDVLGYLYQEGIITEDDVELIKSERTRKAKAECLLDTLPRKGPRAFDEFKKSLNRQSTTKHLAETLLDVPTEGEDVTDSPTFPSTYDQKQNNMKATNEDIYAMNHNPHGICLIINNKEFLGGLSERTGTDVDAMKLKDLFSSLNFTVKVINNASGKQMRDAIKNVAEMDHSVTDCVVVCLLSHGIYDKIYASDCELIPSSELLEPLVRCEQRPQLAGKPRLFFIQACRVVGPVENKHADAGEAKLNAFEVTVHSKGDDEFLASTEQEASSSELLMQESAAPLPANILMSYSTFPGKESWRHLETGSWFIDALVGVFEKYARKEDVMSMIVRVNDAVSKRVSSVGKSKQIPAPFFSLTKKLFFFPQR